MLELVVHLLPGEQVVVVVRKDVMVVEEGVLLELLNYHQEVIHLL